MIYIIDAPNGMIYFDPMQIAGVLRLPCISTLLVYVENGATASGPITKSYDASSSTALAKALGCKSATGKR